MISRVLRILTSRSRFQSHCMIKYSIFLLAFDVLIKLVIPSLSVNSYKRYFMINQQIAWHFVHYSECLYHPFLSMPLK